MAATRRVFLAGLGASGLLSGCVSTLKPGGRANTLTLESLVRQIKHDIGSYIFQHQDDDLTALGTKRCGGQVNFIIQSVKMTVTASADQTESASGGLKVPIGLVTVDASGSRSRTRSDTMTVSLTMFPLTAGKDAVIEEPEIAAQRLTEVPPPSPAFEGTPICDVLNKMRNDLIATADTPPCFNFGEGDQKGNLVKWGFTIIEKAGGGGKLSLLIFSIGAESSITQSVANTIEVNFIASGAGFG